MALVWVDGFDTYGTSIASPVSPTGILTRKYTTQYGTLRVYGPRISGNGYSIRTEGSYIDTPVLTADTKLIIGFGLFIHHWALGIQDGTLFEIYQGSTRRIYGYWHARMAALQIKLDKATDEVIGEIPAKWYRWQYLELAFDTSAGTFEARLNGETVVSASGLTFDSINEIVRLGRQTYPYSYPYFDDFYVCDGTGSRNNDFLGPRKVVTLRPESDVVGYQDWTPLTGVDHWAMVDEEVCDDDSTYVSETDTDETDLFEIDDVSSLLSEVNGLMLYADARKEDGDGDFNLRLPIRLSAVVDEGSSIVVSETAYTGKYRISEEKPGTGDWTASDVDSAQIGVKVPS